MSVSVSWPCSPADSIVIVPALTMRSHNDCENATSLMRCNEMSRPT